MRDFNDYVLSSFEKNGPILQPRQGFSTCDQMSAGLKATASAKANTVCTITLDAFTRVNNLDAAQKAIESGSALNGYPIVNHPAEATREMVDTITKSHGVPVQIRHGSPDPRHIFRRMIDLDLNTTEGGPVSYCLPYGRTPLRQSFEHWAEACQTLSKGVKHSHIESFSGCMMGQMCDPAILIALNILEGLFMRKHGISSLSFSFGQGISSEQDRAALTALQTLAATHFDKGSYHIVVYVFMGFFPKTVGGFCRITKEALSVVRATGVERVILKTPVESRRIPTIEENTAAIEYANRFLSTASAKVEPAFNQVENDRMLAKASDLIERTLAQDSDIAEAILKAFDKGILSIPYCLHPDNKRSEGTVITDDGYYVGFKGKQVENAFSFLSALCKNIEAYDKVA